MTTELPTKAWILRRWTRMPMAAEAISFSLTEAHSRPAWVRYSRSMTTRPMTSTTAAVTLAARPGFSSDEPGPGFMLMPAR